MRLGIFALAVSLAAIVVTVALDVRRDERRARQLAECNATRLALQDEVQRQWRRRFAEPPSEGEMRIVYPAAWTCAQGGDGRWECWVP